MDYLLLQCQHSIFVFRSVLIFVDRSQMEDAGKYSLIAENKNGTDHVDLDLIVVDEVPVGECDMFRHGTLECLCNYRYRCETSEQEMTRIASTQGAQGDTNNEKK